MRQCIPKPLNLIWALVSVSLLAGDTTTAAETVTVHLLSGRSFTGQVDEKSDADTLWMRFESAGRIKVLRPIAWHRVRSAEVGEQSLSGAEFQRQADRLRSSSKMVPRWDVVGEEKSPGPAASNGAETVAHRARGALGFQPRTVSIVASTRLSQWDADREIDGLEVVVTPLDERGAAVSAAGTVSLEFRVPRAVDREQAPRLHGYRTSTVARATHYVREGDYGVDESVVLRLPFRKSLDDGRSYPLGILEVTMVIPGQGTFQTVVYDVPTRIYSRVRDLR